MNFSTYTSSYAPDDATWEKAFEIADAVLNIQQQGNDQQLLRSAWRGQIASKQLVKMLGFSRFHVGALFDAVQEDLPGLEQNAKQLEQVIGFLGMRYAAAVLAINYTCDRVLERKPGPLWRSLLNDMMTHVEIGIRIGMKVPAVGIEGGVLMGFVKGAGLGILLAHNEKEFKQWFRMTEGHESQALLLRSFGCESYQVAAAALQLLGFGPEMAVGAALGIGRLRGEHLQLGPEVRTWQALYHWIDSLRQGRSYPGPLDMRNYFRELAPPNDAKRKNGVLEVLYTEIAGLRRNGSKLGWHLTGIELPTTESMRQFVF